MYTPAASTMLDSFVSIVTPNMAPAASDQTSLWSRNEPHHTVKRQRREQDHRSV